MLDAEELANNIFNDAIVQEAKHLWVEPQQDYLRVRIRVCENTIKEIRHLPKDLAWPVVAQFKKRAGMNPSVETVPKRGFIVYTASHKKHRYLTHSLPTQYGEKIVVSFMENENLVPEPRQPKKMSEQQRVALISGLKARGWFWKGEHIHAPHESMWLLGSDPWKNDLIEFHTRMAARLGRILKSKAVYSDQKRYNEIVSDTVGLVLVLRRLNR